MSIKLLLVGVLGIGLVFYLLQAKKHHPPALTQPQSDLSVINNISSPYGITVVESGIYMSNIFSNEIIHFSHAGKILNSWKSPEFKFPHSILVVDENFLIVSNYKGKVLMFDTKEKKTTPMFESFSEQLKGPVHVLRLMDGGYLITDFDANKLFFAKSDKSLDSEKTNFVNRQVVFNNPHMAAQDSLENIYIADCRNNRLVKFDRSGHLIGWTGFDEKDPKRKGWRRGGSTSKSAEIGGFYSPVSIHIFDDIIYVSEVENHRIQKLTLDGSSVGALGVMDKNEKCILKWTIQGDVQKSNKPGCLNHPYDSYIFDKKIYIADSKNQRIQIIPLDILD